jgi:hypothetical protein
VFLPFRDALHHPPRPSPPFALLGAFSSSLLDVRIYIFVIRRTSFQLEEYEPEQDLVRSAAAAACVFSWGKSETFGFVVFLFYFHFLFYYFSSSSSSFIWGFLHCPDWFS